MKHLHENSCSAPADNRTDIKLIHDPRVVFFGQDLGNLIPGKFDLFSTILLIHLSGCMFSSVDRLGEFNEVWIILIDNISLFNCFNSREFSIPVNFDKADWFDIGVLTFPLQITKCDIVVRSMGRDTHDKAGCHIRVNKDCGEDRHLTTERVRHGFINQVSTCQGPNLCYLMILEGYLFHRLTGEDPFCSVDTGPHVLNCRVDPEVGDSVNRLRTKGCTGNECSLELEHNQGELLDLCFVTFKEVMVSDRVLTLRAISDWMSPFVDMTCLTEVVPLPLDEFAIGRFNRGKSS